MEREHWAELSQAISEVAGRWRESRRYTHPTALVVRVHMWSVLHDRPAYWACDPGNWDDRTRPEALPDQSTMSRRKRTKLFARFMDAVGARLAGRPPAALVTVKRLDGKALPVAAHSRDRDAAWGRGAGQQSNGYKLHLVWAGRPMPEDWAVAPLDVCEKRVARRFAKRLAGAGYLLADAYYDASDLYDLAAAADHQLVAPRRASSRGKGLGHCYQSPHRLRCIGMLEPPAVPPGGTPPVNGFGRSLRDDRRRIERDLGNLTGFGGGLAGLPAWARRIWRVRAWVHGKLLVNAARIRCLRRRVDA